MQITELLYDFYSGKHLAMFLKVIFAEYEIKMYSWRSEISRQWFGFEGGSSIEFVSL